MWKWTRKSVRISEIILGANIIQYLFDRMNYLELGFGVFLFVCGCYDFMYGRWSYYIYLFLQSLTFFIVGFGYVGTII